MSFYFILIGWDAAALPRNNVLCVRSDVFCTCSCVGAWFGHNFISSFGARWFRLSDFDEITAAFCKFHPQWVRQRAFAPASRRESCSRYGHEALRDILYNDWEWGVTEALSVQVEWGMGARSRNPRETPIWNREDARKLACSRLSVSGAREERRREWTK